MSKESTVKTILVATGLSVACSIALATAVTVLKPIQQENRNLDKQRKILAVLGVLPEGQGSAAEVASAFAQLERYQVDFATGEHRRIALDDPFDMRKAVKAPDTSRALTAQEDVAKVRRVPLSGDVYVLRVSNDESRIALPMSGAGLWSTLHGYLVVKQDANTVAGITFTEHAETPGLGGEVDNPNWQAQWVGKQLFGEDGEPRLGLAKNIDPSRPEAAYQVDALSGATLTGNGVSNMVQYWMGDSGFKKFLDNVRTSGV